MSTTGRSADEILFAVIDCPPAERSAYLARACGDDRALRSEVESLLAAWQQAPEFLARPLVVAADSLAEIEAEVETAGEGDDPWLGRRLGSYQLLARLGAGGMGAVYLAERADAEFDKRVAVKLVRADLDDEEALGRFRVERQLLAQLEHPRIARLIDGGVTADGRPFLVMEHVEGVEIDRYCDERRLDLRQRIELFLQVCDAVEYAHRNLVVHRDLKPGNILVTGEGTVRLLDFGIAKALGDGPGVETEGFTVRVGRRFTPRYASPEQLRGAPIATPSDVYSLGVVLYELLCGRSPYAVESGAVREIESAVCDLPASRPAEALDRAPAADPRLAAGAVASTEEISSRRSLAPARLRRMLTGDLETILMMALRKEPERRYPSVQALADDLCRYLEGRPVLARADSLRYRMWRFVGRHRVAVASAALTVALLVVAAATSTVLYLRASAALSETETQRAVTERVSGFLDHMLSQVDPVVTQSREEMRVRDVLDEASRRISSELGDQPEVAAALHSTVGGAYSNLALYEEARAHLTEALELRRAIGSPGELVAALDQLGRLHISIGDNDAAEPLLREALERARELAGSPASLAAAERALAALHRARGEYQPAAERLRRAQDGFRAAGDPVSEGRSGLELGLVLSDAGSFAEAEQRMEEGLALLRAALGEGHSFVAQAHNDLAWVLKAAGDGERSVPHLEKALASYARIFDDDHPKVLIARANLATELGAVGRHDEAVAEHRRVLAGMTAALGEEHPYVAHELNNLGGALEQRGDHAAAAVQYAEAAERYRRIVGAEHPFYAIARSNQARASLLLGDLDGAERAAQEAYEIRRRVLDPDHPDLARSLQQLGQLEMDRGGFARGEELLREALTLREKALRSDHPLTADNRRLLALCLLELARFDEAERHLLAAREALGEDGDAEMRTGVAEALERLVAERSRS